MADVIREFLVSLGFQVDEGKFRRFQQGITAATDSTGKLGKEITAVSLALAAGMQRVADQFEGLYYTAQRTGSTISQLQALRFAASNVGTSIDAVKESLATLQRDLRLPGIYQAYIKQVTGFQGAITSTDQAQNLLFHHWNLNLKQGLEYVNEWEASVLHLNYEALRPYVLNIERADEALARHNERYRNLLGPEVLKKLGDQSVEFNNTWREINDEFQLWIDLFQSRFMGPATDGMKTFLGYLAEVRKWFEYPPWAREGANRTIVSSPTLHPGEGETGQNWMLGAGVGVGALVGLRGLFGLLRGGLGLIGLGGGGAAAAGGRGILGAIFGLPGLAAAAAVLGGGYALKGQTQDKPTWDPHKDLSGQAPPLPGWWENLKKWMFGDKYRPQDGGGAADELVHGHGWAPRSARKMAYDPAGGGVFDDLRDWLHGSTSFVPAVHLTDALGTDLFNRGQDDYPLGSTKREDAPAFGRRRHGDPFGLSPERPGTPGTGDPKTALDAIEKFESHGRNIMNFIGDALHTASGFWQITNATWRKAADKYGIDISGYPTAMSAPRALQERVATELYKHEGFSPWAPYNRWLRAFLHNHPGFPGTGSQSPGVEAQSPGGSNHGSTDNSNYFYRRRHGDPFGFSDPVVATPNYHRAHTNNVQHTSNITINGGTDPSTTVALLEDLMRRDNGDMVRNMTGAVV